MSHCQIFFDDPRDADDAYRDLNGLKYKNIIFTISRNLQDNKVLDVTFSSHVPSELMEDIFDIFYRYGRVSDIIDVTPTTYQIEAYPAKDFLIYYQESKYTDQTLVVGEQSFEVHRIILATTSIFFRDLFSEFEQSVLEIPDVDPILFAELLNLIYGAEMPLAGLQTLRLMTLVDYFGVQNVNITKIISRIQIDPEDIPEYNNLLNQL